MEGRTFLLDREIIFNSLEEGIIAINDQEEIVYINKAAAEMLNTTEKDAVGQPLHMVYPASKMGTLLQTNEAEYNVPMKSMKNVRILSDRFPVREDGRAVGVVAVFRNKTEVTRMAEELTGVRYMIDAMRANNHEFTNKLHVILGLIEMGAYEEASRYIRKTAMIQKEIISFILNTIEIPEVAALLIGKISRGGELGIDVVLEPGSHLKKEGNIGYAHVLVSIIGNLLENAMEALDGASSENKKISIGVYQKDHDILVTICDNGPGIPEKIQYKIFEKGFSTKGTERGLGLYQVQQLARDYGGEITVESEEGSGTYFTVNLKTEA